jgi:acylphosphatase
MVEKFVSCHILFKGMVQGVGFRYTALHVARSLSLGGFARNLYTGDVEVKIEGDKDKIMEFIRELEEKMKGYISKTETNWGEFKGEVGDFAIRF